MYLDYKNASDPAPRLMDGDMYICTTTCTEDKYVKNLHFNYGYSNTLKVTISTADLHGLVASKDGFEKLIWELFPDATIRRFSDYEEWQHFTSNEQIAIKLYRKNPKERFVVLVSKNT